MKESRWAVSIITFGLGLFVLCWNFASAGIVIDDFNATRPYPTCCGEYGTYWAFDSNVVQNGSGTLVVGGTASDNGGFYRDKRGEVLWNFTAQSNLVLRAKVLPDNQATNFYVVFRDATGNRALYTFTFSDLNSSNFTALSKPLFTPDWTDGAPFDFTRVISMDIYGEFTEADSPLRLELDSIETQGPSVIGLLHMDYRTTNGVLVLSWSTNLTNGFLLQSSPTVLGGWGNATNIVVVSNEYRFAVLMADETRFYRLLATSDPLAEYPVMNEEEFWASLPSSDSLLMRSEASLVMADEPILTDFPSFPPMPPLPPMPDERLGLMANRAMVSEMQASAMNSGTPPPPVGTVIPTNSYIDVVAYSSHTTNMVFIPGGTNISAEQSYSLTYSNHAGGSDHYQWLAYTSNVPSQVTYEYTTIWDPLSTNWPSGVWISQGCEWVGTGCPPETNIVDAPFVPVETFAGISFSGYEGSTYRQANIQLDLHVGRAFSNNWTTFVLLSNTASRVDAIGYRTSVTQSSPIAFSNITVLGQSLNIDDKLFTQLPPSMVTNVTPTIVGASNYTFDLKVVRHHVVPLTRIYHQYFHKANAMLITNKAPALADLQGYFNAGSMLLATDNDNKIPDSDTNVVFSTNQNSLYRNDDVPVYVEFQISDGPTNYCLFTRTGLPVFDRYFGTNKAPAYFDIIDVKVLEELGTNMTANIKQVNSITLDGDRKNGYGPMGYPPSIVLSELGLNNVTPVHEWGHNCGIYHRGKPDTNGVIRNPGGTLDAIMGDWLTVITNFPRTEINRFERSVINTNLNNYYP